MQHALRACTLAVVLSSAISAAHGADPAPGASVDSLLQLVKAANPEYAAMRHEADAASERVTAAGALPDPRLRVELQDITMGGEQNPTLSPKRVGATKYQLMQDLPWLGKRDLRRGFPKSLVREHQDLSAAMRAEQVTLLVPPRFAHLLPEVSSS